MFSVMYFNVAFEMREGSRGRTKSLVGGLGETSFSISRERERKVISVLGESSSREGKKLFFVFVYFFQLGALAREENCLAREKSDFWCVGVVVKSLVKVPRVFIDGKCTERGGKKFSMKIKFLEKEKKAGKITRRLARQFAERRF